MQTTTPVSLATLSTGATPSIHGVVAGRWFDYVGNKEVMLIEDRKEQSVNYSGGSGSYSPRNLVAQTLSDALAQQHPDSRIATIAVDAFGETEVIARPCTEEAFLSQFIGKAGPFTADVVTGATFTSNAVINAVNSLFGK